MLIALVSCNVRNTSKRVWSIWPKRDVVRDMYHGLSSADIDACEPLGDATFGPPRKLEFALGVAELDRTVDESSVMP